MKWSLLAAFVATTLLTGCPTPPPQTYHEVAFPVGYAEVAGSHYQHRAVSSRGNIFALNIRHNPDENTDLAYWREAIEYQKAELDGLLLVARDSLKSDDGIEGVLFRFEVGEGDDMISYFIGVFVTEEDLWIYEVGGEAASMEAELTEIIAAMQSLKLPQEVEQLP